MKLHDYAPLNTQTDEIRLLRIVQMGDVLEAEIQHFVIGDDCPEFGAVSYLWGTPQSNLTIKIGSTSLRVAPNAYAALSILAEYQFAFLLMDEIGCEDCEDWEQQPEWLWIDSICINQADIGERNHQVSMMRKIYGSAATVYSWLGNGSPRVFSAMRMLRDFTYKEFMHRQYEEDISYCRDDFDFDASELSDGLYELFSNPYWKRIWMVQEFIIGKWVVVLCGKMRISWDQIGMFFFNRFRQSKFEILHLRVATRLQSTPANPLIQCRNAMSVSKESLEIERPWAGHLLSHLTKVFEGWGSSDPRDKVYALIGLVGSGPEVDYAKSTGEVFDDTMKFYIEHSRFQAAYVVRLFAESLARSLRLGERKIRAISYLRDGVCVFPESPRGLVVGKNFVICPHGAHCFEWEAANMGDADSSEKEIGVGTIRRRQHVFRESRWTVEEELVVSSGDGLMDNLRLVLCQCV
ncbi:uncharacterized protein MKZ38_009491 [Zalerion maritima]|uniref:Heterokaryon incompatibility domain-containing protein n=1 Tax=Zalerion maritima TaxID=339359 RepID=A0AAD5RGI3_9PEZI|nr:uncharacterized protein MKZ38_009491 [Zalerion maritima]